MKIGQVLYKDSAGFPDQTIQFIDYAFFTFIFYYIIVMDITVIYIAIMQITIY